MRALIPAWLAVFIFHRALVLALGFDALFYWEETYRLLVARAFLEGWQIPWMDLQADPYAGGSLVLSLLATPLVAAGGGSVVGLKWLALLWAAAGLAAWLILVGRYFGTVAANVFAVCYVFAPPLFVIYNLVAMGSHAETLTLSAIQLLLVLAYVGDPDRSKLRLAAWLAFAGLSVWFTYTSALTLAVCAAFALAAGALPLRRWPLAAAALACGLAPWIAYNVLSGGATLPVVARTFSPAVTDPRGYPFVVRDLLSYGLMIALQFGDLTAPGGGLRISRFGLANAYWAVCGLAWLACVWRCGRRLARERPLPATVASSPELPLLALFPLFVAIIAGSDHLYSELGLVPFFAFRVLVPALPAAFFAVPVAASRLPRWACACVVCLLVLLGAAGTAQVISAGSASRPAVERDTAELGAKAMGHLLMVKHGNDVALFRKRIAALPEELRAPAYHGVGFSLAYFYGFGEGRPVAPLAGDLGAADPAYLGDVLAGIGDALGPGMPQVRALPGSERTRTIAHVAAKIDGRARER